MSFEITLCATVYCDRCLTLATDRRGSAQHWADREAAVTDLLSLGWQVNTLEDRAICAVCVQTLTCLNEGHDWGAWQNLLPLGVTGNILPTALRTCRRCNQTSSNSDSD